LGEAVGKPFTPRAHLNNSGSALHAAGKKRRAVQISTLNPLALAAAEFSTAQFAPSSSAAMSVQNRGGPEKKESNFVGAMGNFSIQYNLSAASIALPFLQSHPAFDPPTWVHYVGLGAVFVGAVLGMLGMGYLGDALGRKRAMVVTLAIQVAGAVGCSLLTWGSVQTIYAVFCASRLLLGVGVGGMYPLSASHSAEGSSEGEDAGARVGWAFFWQTPGSMAPYAVGLLLVLGVGDKQCSYFEQHDACVGAALPTAPAPVALPSLGRPSGAYCCGPAVSAPKCNGPDVSMLVADFVTDTTLKLGVTIAGEEHDCPAENITYSPDTFKISFPDIAKPKDCLGKIDSSSGGTTPTVKYVAKDDLLKVGEDNVTIVLKKGSCGAEPGPEPEPEPEPEPGPIPQPSPHPASSCAWNASGHAICSYNASAPTSMPSLEYRLITGLGIIPPLIVMASAISSMHDSDEFKAARSAGGGTASPIAEVMAHPEYWGTLLGTGGTWFLYDISYYGTAIFMPQILATIFGQGESLYAICWQSLVNAAIGLPGVVAAILCLKRYGNRWLDIYGFFLCAILFAAMAITYQIDPKASNLLFAELLLLTFALNFGPNVATFVLPAVAFPPQVRSTFHGLSAGSGKVGAVVGTFIYAPLADAFGIATVMWIQCALCLLGVVLSIYCIDDDHPRTKAAETLRAGLI
jgi:MFS family permease